MIVIQILLIVILLAVGVNFISSRNSNATRAAKKLAILLAIPCAIFVILFPDTTTRAANTVGVGRGADLLLYIFIVLTIFQLFDSYLKTKDDQKQVVSLARKIAIMEAQQSKHNAKK